MKLHRAIISILVVATAAFAGPVWAARQAGPEEADIDAFVRRAMAVVGTVPGLSLAVVDGEEIVMASGYGVADIRIGAPVDAETEFYIASATKSFTALAISGMAARGEVDLEAPVARWMGNAGLATDLASSVSLADLLSHRSGLDNAPMAFRAAYSGDHTPDVMRGLLASTARHPETPHGSFRYTNAGYNIATTLIEARFGRDWRVMVRDGVLIPAGMKRTTAWISKATASGLVAQGHLGDLTTTRPSSLQKVDATMQSAGGLVSTANDMARWLELQINDGVIDGRRVFPEGLIASTHRPQVAQDNDFGAYHRDGYGLGWQTGRYGTDVLIHHFGNFSGSRAHVSFMPERHLGVVVMVNEDLFAGDLADVVANYVYDRLAGRPDLGAAYDIELATLVDRRDRKRAAVATARAERSARPWRLSRSMASYVGTYVNPAMGSLSITTAEGQMTVSIGVLSAIAEAYIDPESVRVELVPFQGDVVTFKGSDRLVFGDATFVRTGGEADCVSPC